MDRRAFIGRMALGVVAVPVAVDAQQPAKVARIGYLATGPLESPEQRSVFDAFRQGMRELGYVEGRNIVIVVREADGRIERFPALAKELVGLKVDVIVATNSLTGRAVQRPTSTIPTVVPIMGDPVGNGLVASLARPGGNITGLAFIGGEATLPPLPPRSPTACAPSPCPPGPTSARRIPAGAAGTARSAFRCGRRGRVGPGAPGHRGSRRRRPAISLERGELRARSGREMFHPPAESAASRPTPRAEVHHERAVH
jgi:hypothetical protein